MGNILFASNNPTHFSPLAFTSVSFRDATRVPYSVAFQADLQTPAGAIAPTTTGEVWIHFRCSTDNIGYAGAPTADAVRVYSDSGALLLKGVQGLNSSTIDWTFYDTNGSSLTTNDKGDINNNQGAWDIRLIFDPFSLVFEIYQNTILLGTLSFGANPNSVTTITGVDWRQAWYNEDSTGYLSEVIIADSDTRLARLNMIRPSGIGNYTDWLGNVATLADNNVNTGMTTNAINQRTSIFLETYTNTEIISNLVVASQHFRGSNSPGNIRHFLRASNIDYDAAAAFPVGFNLSVSQTDYPINPSTSLPWDLNDLPLTEFGFKSEA